MGTLLNGEESSGKAITFQGVASTECLSVSVPRRPDCLAVSEELISLSSANTLHN